MYQGKHITAVIPALDEASSIGKVIHGLQQLRELSGVAVIDEIIVCDNGSTDETAQVAKKAGACVVQELQKGYGFACLRALKQISATDVVLFIDADRAFFEEQALDLLAAIHRGADLVIGSRELGVISPFALTFPQRFGNRLATFLIKWIWGYAYTDLGPFRAVRWQSLNAINMQDTHYGWTIEMQIKALLMGLVIAEVPVDTRMRIGQSKISGTVKGTIKAGIGILSMIAKLRWQTAFFKSTEAEIR